MPGSSAKSVLVLHNASVLGGAVCNLPSGQTSEPDPAGVTSRAAILYLVLARCCCSSCRRAGGCAAAAASTRS